MATATATILRRFSAECAIRYVYSKDLKTLAREAAQRDEDAPSIPSLTRSDFDGATKLGD
jgi:hypothetical protein